MEKPTRQKGNAGRCTKQRSKGRYPLSRKKKHREMRQKKLKELEESVVVVDEVVAESTLDDNPLDLEDENVPTVDETLPDIEMTASCSKMIDIEEEVPAISEDTVSDFCLMDMSILATFVSALSCPECHCTNLNLFDILEKKKGLAKCLQLRCDSCLFTKEFYTSKKIDPPLKNVNKGGGSFMEVNKNSVWLLLELGMNPSKKNFVDI